MAPLAPPLIVIPGPAVPAAPIGGAPPSEIPTAPPLIPAAPRTSIMAFESGASALQPVQSAKHKVARFATTVAKRRLGLTLDCSMGA
jgi:hypothetical protein